MAARASGLILFSLLIWSSLNDGTSATEAAEAATVDVGFVLDMGTLVGKMGRTSVSMAVDDFYAAHPDYTSRLIIHTRDSKGGRLPALSAALDLLENVEVKAIVGPQTSSQAIFLLDAAQESQVPLLSFSASSPSLSTLRTPYFVRTTANDAAQVPAVAAVIKAFGWREAILVYEDTDYGRDMVPYLVDALQEIDARIPYRSVIPVSPSDERISEELYKLMTMQTRVFVVHTSAALGSRLFSKAHEVGMMSKGYVWIMTDGLLTNIVDTLSSSLVESMQGVLGVKLHVPRSQVADDFSVRWRRRFQNEYPDDPPTELNVYGRWAYDTVWALAMAVEKAGSVNSTFVKPNTSDSGSVLLENFAVSTGGPKLLAAILGTRFAGASGEFRIVDGQLRTSAYQIINVIGRGGRGIGFWTPESGISRQLKPNRAGAYATLASDLGPVIWPGEPTAVPLGWEIPTSGKKLRIGVPVKDEFQEFVNVKWDPVTNATSVTGYCIEVFEAVLKKLPYAIPYEFIPFPSKDATFWSYDELIYQIYLQKFDAVVGDATIRANRSLYADYTLPFTEAGIAMIVPVKESIHKNAWIFLKPLTVDLWFGTLAFFFYTGLVLWVIEHRVNKKFRGTITEQIGTVFHFAFSTLVFAHKEKLEHILSKIVVVIWVFVVLIITSSYTASLASMLTVQQLQPTITSLQELQVNGDYVGYHRGSYVEGLLKELNFKESKIRAYNYSGYVEALSKGSKNGGVSAIVHEIPYIKLFLAQHCSRYTMVGPIFKTAGKGFAFPKGSPLVHDISRGILKVIEGDEMLEIERKWFGDEDACLTQGSTITSTNLGFSSFWGLFLITGVTSTTSLVIYLAMFIRKNWRELRNIHPGKPIPQRIMGWIIYYDAENLEEEEATDATDDVVPPSLDIDETQHRLSASNLSDLGSDKGEEESTPNDHASPSTTGQIADITVERS